MTNTRIGDAEIIEMRYPVELRAFSLRPGSGGGGLYPGGEGVTREMAFLRGGITATVLTERRARPPPGLAGGGDGAPGRNLLLRHRRDQKEDAAEAAGAGAVINLGGKNSVEVAAGDRIRIETPGGGGYGQAGEAGGQSQASKGKAAAPKPRKRRSRVAGAADSAAKATEAEGIAAPATPVAAQA